MSRGRACAGSGSARTATEGGALEAHGRVLNQTLGTNGAEEQKARATLPGISPASIINNSNSIFNNNNSIFNKVSIFLSSFHLLGTFSTMALPTRLLLTPQTASPTPRTSTSGFRR